MKSVSKIRHIQESNLRLEKRYLIEQVSSGDTPNNQKIIEIKDQSDIPTSLVENPPINGFLNANKGTHDSQGQYMDLIDISNNVYRLRNWGTMNFAGHKMPGFITSFYNYDFSEVQNTPEGGFIAYFPSEGKIGSEVVPKTKDKWIGFSSQAGKVQFACFKDSSGKIVCKEYYYKKADN